ncbi:MAG: phosphate signaling complex protein PhoU [Methanosarcinales archaeon]|nr:phosphate signaling complex protein PhoU [ANME-2 cluster archaeon]MDW7776762.1 phosphate signaling complex protein PhoU [Methanosarcinales archaeon]
MVRKVFQMEMDRLETDVIRMAQLTRDAVSLSVDSLRNQDVEMAARVIELEEKSDVLNIEISDLGMMLTATQQPVARDLRFLSSMMKISDYFERICDYAEKIARITMKSAHKPLLRPLVDIPRMSDNIRKMIDLDIDAIQNRDAGPTERLSPLDDVIDALYQTLYTELLNFMINDTTTIDDATDLLFVARYLERIGDITCKIGSMIVFMLDGKRVWIK